MSYSNAYFSKDLEDLTYEDIENFFFTEREESDKIEFKSNGSQVKGNQNDVIDKVIKAICGMLNSEGGIVIWGAPVGKQMPGRKEKVFIGDLTPVEYLIEKDSFISKIADSITPSPKGIKFQRIENGSKCIGVIEIEQSPYSPHQTKDGIYYMRLDGQTRPAPHHYVEALFKKVSFPDLVGYMKIDSITDDFQQYRLKLTFVFLNMSEMQNEHEFYYKIHLIDAKFMGYGNYRGEDYQYSGSGTELKAYKYRPTLFNNDPFDIVKYIEVDKKIDKITVLIFFGGKQSPLKVSAYNIAIKFPAPENLNDLLLHKNENQFSYNATKGVGLESLKLILGRPI